LRTPRRRLSLVLLAAFALVALAAPAASQAAKHRSKPKTRVMTRNLYLGADLTPGLQATSLNGLNDAAGEILNQVGQNKFSTRARGLASEILGKKPDLVGLQEAALWRTDTNCHYTLTPTAKHVRYDFIKLLLKRLNRGKRRYKLVVSQNEFDFETEANTDGSPDHSCDTNVRLTMRDAILVRLGQHIKLSHKRKGHFKTLYTPKLIGAIAVPVTRGWVSVQVKKPHAKSFRFVDTHFEAFDSQASNPTNDPQHPTVGNGEVRQAQAQELTAKGGPAAGKRETILVGDLNSDKRTEVKPGDGLAYKWLLHVGYRERSAVKPNGCCLNTALLTSPGGGGKVKDFDHKVDHIMTNTPKRVKLISSSVTGRKPVHGFWDSDHAGLFSSLRIP
jgi:endonuclease/exonuclease/phosphatase family metal-dependent hydrolase